MEKYRNYRRLPEIARTADLIGTLRSLLAEGEKERRVPLFHSYEWDKKK